MEAIRRERIIKQLADILNVLKQERPTAYNRCVDVTEKLFYKRAFTGGVVLVMNAFDYNELAAIWHTETIPIINGLGVKRGFCTPHGDVDYLIIDNKIKEMFGYLIDAEDE